MQVSSPDGGCSSYGATATQILHDLRTPPCEKHNKGLCASQGPKSAAEIEKEQEAKLKAKYNNIGAKKKLMPKV